MRLIPLGSNKKELQLDNGVRVFFSYRTPVAAVLADGSVIRTSTRYSVTTSKHIGQWLPSKATEVDQSVIDALV